MKHISGLPINVQPRPLLLAFNRRRGAVGRAVTNANG